MKAQRGNWYIEADRGYLEIRYKNTFIGWCRWNLVGGYRINYPLPEGDKGTFTRVVTVFSIYRWGIKIWR